MKVLEFMNSHSNWEETLIGSPYYIKIKRDGPYIILKYNQFNSDFSIPIVRECRSVIFYYHKNGTYECVCRAFDKFGNYGESYIADIDWSSSVVEEKIDGSLMKLYYHDGQWRIATNGTINAFEAEINDIDLNFGDLFYEALGGIEYFKELCNCLDQINTYMFELVSPKFRVTIDYPETKLYYLGERNIITMKESKDYTHTMHGFGIFCPQVYPLHTLDDCLEYVKTMTKDQEGFVIKDKNFNRIKLKSPEYLLAFHANNNGVVTIKRVINMIKNETLDDFLAYCPQHKDTVQKVVDNINLIVADLEQSWIKISSNIQLERKDFAKHIINLRNKDFLWAKYDNPNLSAFDWLMSKYTSKIKDMIEQYKERNK